MRRRHFTTQLPDLSGVVVWLSQHGLTRTRIADVLKIPLGNVDVILHRERTGVARKREQSLLDAFDNRLIRTNRAAFPKAIRILPQKAVSTNVLETERLVNEYAEAFWEGVPYLSGLGDLGSLLKRVSEPDRNNLPLLRVQARVYSLRCETYLHAGYAFSALNFGLDAHGLWEWVYQKSSSALDLEQLAKTVLLISNSFISRRDVARAKGWLDLAREAFSAANAKRRRWPDPEYLRQMASVARGEGDLAEARVRLKAARAALPYTVPDATPEQMDDMADRVLNVIADIPNWDGSLRLLENSFRAWPAFDSHRASNLLWTVSGGLQTDSKQIHTAALDLLNEHSSSTDGFGLQATGAYLLGLTPRIPEYLRKAWAMFAISYNAYSHK